MTHPNDDVVHLLWGPRTLCGLMRARSEWSWVPIHETPTDMPLCVACSTRRKNEFVRTSSRTLVHHKGLLPRVQVRPVGKSTWATCSDWEEVGLMIETEGGIGKYEIQFVELSDDEVEEFSTW